jgi:hypothetical protein
VSVAHHSFLFMIFLIFLELSLFVEKQSLNHPALRKVVRDFEHGAIVFNVLPYDIKLKLHRGPLFKVGFDLNQCAFV